MAGSCERVDVVAEFDERAPRYDTSAVHRWQARQAAELACLQWRGSAVVPRADTCGPTAPALPFRAEVFDVVICVAAIAYLGDAVTALRESRRVCRPGARLVLSVPANGGIPSFALLREAARAHGVALSEPNAGLGDEDTRRSVLGSAGLLCDGVVERTFAEPLAGDSRSTAEHFISHGHAEPLRVAPREVRERVYATYRDSFVQQQQNGTGHHTVLYVRCRAPGAT